MEGQLEDATREIKRFKKENAHLKSNVRLFQITTGTTVFIGMPAAFVAGAYGYKKYKEYNK